MPSTIHIHENLAAPKPDWIQFWLLECRTPVQLMALARSFAAECQAKVPVRPLLAHALSGNEALLN